jgi:PIN domain nuclease of toxin-antitoxin system
MRLLVDTHIFLWYVEANARLSSGLRDAIQDEGNEVYLSTASVWEAVIKYALGKLPLPAEPAVYLPQKREAHSIASLPVNEGALVHLSSLPLLHRDPFDRMLVAQALQHGLIVVTLDAAVRAYAVPTLP